MQLLQQTVSIEGVLLLLIGLSTASSSQDGTYSMETITYDDTDSTFAGWFPTASTWSQVYIDEGYEWVTSGSYAIDCPVTEATCQFATECDTNTLYFDDGSYEECSLFSSCITITIYQTSPYGSPSAAYMGCQSDWMAFTIYREISVVESFFEEASSTAKPSVSVTPSSASATSMTSSSYKTPSSTATPATASGSSGSKAWIAGAVIGALALIGLFILGAWFYRRRQQKKSAAVHHQSTDMNQLPPASNQPPTTPEIRYPEYNNARDSGNTYAGLSVQDSLSPTFVYRESVAENSQRGTPGSHHLSLAGSPSTEMNEKAVPSKTAWELST